MSAVRATLRDHDLTASLRPHDLALLQLLVIVLALVVLALQAA